MAILNLTPDSFSCDGKHSATFTPSSLLPQLQSLLHNQISILDIGGQSTRPHATPLSASEELARVLPTVQFIRSNPAFKSILLSIDTYHSSVARACVEAGADIINDVSGGLMDDNMLATVAELRCTYILMHMRGTPETMNTLTSYPNGVIQGVGTELEDRVKKAMEAGVRRWRIILDPGIGFAKTADQNLEILRNLPKLREREGLKGLPWCVGVSRKAFIGKISEVDGGWVHPRESAGKDEGPRYIMATESETSKRVQDAVKSAPVSATWGQIGFNQEAPPALEPSPSASEDPNPLTGREAKPDNGPAKWGTAFPPLEPPPPSTTASEAPNPLKAETKASTTWGTMSSNPTPLASKNDANPNAQNEKMRQRAWGTAAAVTACVQGGVDVVRVHDWVEMGKVVRIAEAVWRV
ncbi:MAG: hypothetical protein Q9182_004918 [Xanthomendoza sp. 2 TL-2023]